MGTVSSLKEKLIHDNSFNLDFVLNNNEVALISVNFEMHHRPCRDDMRRSVLLGMLLKKGHTVDNDNSISSSSKRVTLIG